MKLHLIQCKYVAKSMEENIKKWNALKLQIAIKYNCIQVIRDITSIPLPGPPLIRIILLSGSF